MYDNKLIYLSNSYYNEALEFARQRRLNKALFYLKKALFLNKNNIEARNLKGLILYETGEYGEAVLSWICSINLKKEDNKARDYLNRLELNSGTLDIKKQYNKDFNQALSYASQGYYDDAMHLLKYITNNDEKYIRAHNLLTLLYIKNKQYDEAFEIIDKVLKIDVSNDKALGYKEYIEDVNNDGIIRLHKKKNKKSAKRKKTDDVLIPKKYFEYHGWQTAVNILTGLIIGAATIFFLYIPTHDVKLNSMYNDRVNSINEKLNSANMDNAKLQKEKNDFEKELKYLREEKKSGEESNNYISSQYELVIGIVNSFYSNNFDALASYYTEFDNSSVMNSVRGDINVAEILKAPIAQALSDGYIRLVQMGDSYYEKGDFNTALSFYDKSLKIKPEYTVAMFKKGLALDKMGKRDDAMEIYRNIIVNYPNTHEANMAKQERGY